MSKAKKWAIELDEKYESVRETLLNKTFSGRENVALTIFAASVGLKYGKYEPTQKPKFQAAFSVADVAENKSHAHFFAFHHTKEKETLNNIEECWKIVSAYANGGLDQIQEWYIEVSEKTDDLEQKILNEMQNSTIHKLPEE